MQPSEYSGEPQTPFSIEWARCRRRYSGLYQENAHYPASAYGADTRSGGGPGSRWSYLGSCLFSCSSGVIRSGTRNKQSQAQEQT